MHDTGEVKRDVVIEVLKAHGVDVSISDSDPTKFVLAKGERVEEQTFSSEHVSKRMLQYLQRQYDVPIHRFYHPEMMP